MLRRNNSNSRPCLTDADYSFSLFRFTVNLHQVVRGSSIRISSCLYAANPAF